MSDVAAVVVTYGNRRELLLRVLEQLTCEAVAKVVVVDNGSGWDLKGSLSGRYGSLVDILTMGSNTGSARGFAAGIAHAVAIGCQYLLLLDDDNYPRPGMLSTLLAAHKRASVSTPRDRLAVAAMRPARMPDSAVAWMLADDPPADSFHSFHLIDLPSKLWRRTPWGRPRASGLPELISLKAAVYGGLLFHRDLVAMIGLPNPAFVLYGDDIEYTLRITRAGGRILLVTAALLDDLELSAWQRSAYKNRFGLLLGEPSDLRAYYTMRNSTYLSHRYLRQRALVYALNRVAFTVLLGACAIAYRKQARYRLLRRAMLDGLRGRMGVCQEFPP